MADNLLVGMSGAAWGTLKLYLGGCGSKFDGATVSLSFRAEPWLEVEHALVTSLVSIYSCCGPSALNDEYTSTEASGWYSRYRLLSGK